MSWLRIVHDTTYSLPSRLVEQRPDVRQADAVAQEEVFRTHMLSTDGSEAVTETVADSIRRGESSYDPETRIWTLDGLRMQISREGLVRKDRMN
jgi:hypothetical protein